jgi:hypothetical protein
MNADCPNAMKVLHIKNKSRSNEQRVYQTEEDVRKPSFVLTSGRFIVAFLLPLCWYLVSQCFIVLWKHFLLLGTIGERYCSAYSFV